MTRTLWALMQNHEDEDQIDTGCYLGFFTTEGRAQQALSQYWLTLPPKIREGSEFLIFRVQEDRPSWLEGFA